MGKVIKNVVKTVVATFCGLLLLVLVVPLGVSLVVSVPSVQNAIVERLTRRLTASLGTRVAIDRVNVKLINHIELEGFYVEDFGGDTLLWIPRLTAPIEDLGLRGRQLTFGRVKVSGGQIWLRKETEQEEMNISRVVDSVRRGRNTDSHFRMRIAEIEGDSLTFGLQRGDVARREEGVDFSRFVVRDVHTRIDDFEIAGDTIRMNIRSLRGEDRSGWRVDDVTVHPLVISRGAVTLRDVEVSSSESALRLANIRLLSTDGAWSNFGEFTDSVRMEISMLPSRVTSQLVGAFVPAVAGWGVVLDDVTLSTNGVLSELSGEVSRARTLATEFSLDFTSRGLPHFKTARFDARLASLATNSRDIDSLVHSITEEKLPGGISAILGRMGALTLTGAAKGKLNDFSATASLLSDAGSLTGEAKVATSGQGTAVDGTLTTAGFELGRALSVKDMGALTGIFTGRMATEPLRGSVDGDIESLEFRDHTYSALAVGGSVEARHYEVNLTARDPALEAVLKASLDRTAETPRVELELDVARADLAAMRLDREDSVSVVSAELVADIAGHGLDDANGSVELRHARYRSAEGSVETPLVKLEAHSTAAGKLLTLASDFADAEFRSRTGYRDMLAYLGGFLQKHIPVGSFGRAAEALVPPDGGSAAAISNYSIVSLHVKDTEQLLAALAPTASIAQGSSARFMFNPYTGLFNLSAASDFVEYKGILAADISLTADNAADSLVVYLSGTDIYSSRGHIPHFEMQGGARGRIRADVSLDGKVWRIATDSLGIEAGRVAFRGARFYPTDNPERRLSATGVVSHLPSDTLHVSLNRFDLSPLGRIVRGGGIDFRGEATGKMDIAGLMESAQIDADVELLGLGARGLTAPPLRFLSTPLAEGGVDFRLLNQSAGDDVVRGTLSRGGEIDARVSVDSLDAGLLDPLLGGVLEDTRGTASARLTLGGTLRTLDIDGTIEVPQIETTVAYTRARYTAEGARIAVENSVMSLPWTPVTNPLGGSGELALRVDMSNLKDIRAEIDARTRAMLAFDTQPDDSEAFYGRVFATGSVGIRSGRMTTVMNISGRTDPGTRFHLPLNSKSNVSWADFVVFSDNTTPADTTDVLARKRESYRRRLSGGAGSRRAKPLEMNLTASITPDAEVHMLIDPNLGQGITGRGEGIIDLKINPTSNLFTMTGDYNISSGRFEFSMMDVFNKTFEISPGSTLRWSGAPDDALLSVDGSYRVRTSLLPLVGEGSGLVSGRSVPVDCIIRLRERLSEPEITFDIALPSADPEQRQVVEDAMNTEELKSMQFLSLLTTGSFASDNSITGQSANAGVAATGAVGFDILTNQLNNFLSSDDYDIYFRYRPQDGFATNEVDMGFSTGFWDNRLQLEIEGNWVDNRAATSVGTGNASNLVGDVSLTWAIDRAGNLRLNVFSRNIDRRDENQGLQESGLGVHYKKDFNSLRDIFRRSAGRAGDKNKNTTFATDSVIVKTIKKQR
jgi:hypothetical protein